jgi:hypothetical protein
VQLRSTVKFRDTRLNILLPNRLSPERYEAACNIFKDTADEDYFFSRTAWNNSNFRQFSWSASQAIEKYLKCAFLIQGGDAKFSHDWIEKVIGFWTICKGLGYQVESNLEPVSDEITILDGEKYQESLNNFLCRISKNGHTGVRYNEYDYLDIELYDLHKLDSVCYLLRDLCIPLDGALLEDDSQAGQPKPALMPFPRNIMDKTDLSSGNYSFFPEIAGSPKLHIVGSSSPLAMLITKGDEETIKWLRENTKLDSKTIQKVQTAVEATRQRNR